MSINKYLSGDYNVQCDVCGKKRKRSQCVLAYGSGTEAVVMSCRDGCADYDHPLNYPPPIIFDGRPVEDARPIGTTSYITSLSMQRWVNLTEGVWGAFNGLNNSFSTNPIKTWGNF